MRQFCPRLYAAGDAATRELICDGFTGGGSHNAAWAMSSGYWAGEAAGRFAQSLGNQHHQRSVQAVGMAGVRGEGKQKLAATDVITATQAEVFPYDRNLFRSETVLQDSLDRLDTLWDSLRHSSTPSPDQSIRTREAAAMVATARWMYRSGLHRQETRGMHKRTDYQQQDPNQKHYVISGGLDQVWVKTASLASPVEAARELVAL